MSQIGGAFLDKSIQLLTDEYVPKIEQSLHGLTTDDIWWRANEASNSIGNLILHLCGNVTEWIIGGVGQQPFLRRRQEEFDHREPLTAEALERHLNDVVDQAAAVLRAVQRDAVLDKRRIQGYDVTVLDAIYHVVEHFSMHTGQIILLSKARQGRHLRLWEPPGQRA